MHTRVRSDLFAMRDEKYAAFNARLVPNIAAGRIIGVRSPQLQKYARQMPADVVTDFVNAAPHMYMDENNLHAILLSRMRDFDECVAHVDRFIGYVDNWGTCDSIAPRVFARHTDELLPYIRRWIRSNHTYTVRFAIGMLMRFYLGDNFRPEYLDMVASVRSDEYYVNMMRAWYFATALAKNWDAVICVFRDKLLDAWTHNKSIQKACESYRITDTQKDILRKMKIHV